MVRILASRTLSRVLVCAVMGVNAAYIFRSDSPAVIVFAAIILGPTMGLLVYGLYRERHRGDGVESNKEAESSLWMFSMNSLFAGLLLVSIVGVLGGV